MTDIVERLEARIVELGTALQERTEFMKAQYADVSTACATSMQTVASLRASLLEMTEDAMRWRASNDAGLHAFVNAAAGEGLVLDGVDAADLYIATFPERYAATVTQIETGAVDSARAGEKT